MFMPTPRPASLVALSTVEKPGWNSSENVCFASSAAASLIRDEALLQRGLLDALGGQALAVILDR